MRSIKLYNPHLPEYAPLKACVHRKDLILTECGTMPDNTKTVIMTAKNLQIRGMNACIQYLEEKFPYPPFFPQEPEKRAVVRMALDELIRNPKNLDVYATNIPEVGFFAGPTPTILDIYLYAIAPDTGSWTKFKEDFVNA